MKFATILAVPALLLAGCSFYGSEYATPVKMYDGPEKTVSQVASVMTFNFQKKRDNQLETAWRSNVIEIDGKPAPGDKYANQKLLLDPGAHFLTIRCSSGYTQNTQTQKFRIILGANQLYTPSAHLLYGTGDCTPDVSLIHVRS